MNCFLDFCQRSNFNVKFRADDEDDEFQSQFEADLAMMDSEECVDAEITVGDGPEN